MLGVFSFSKTYAMTGIRIGALVAPRSFERTLPRDPGDDDLLRQRAGAVRRRRSAHGLPGPHRDRPCALSRQLLGRPRDPRREGSAARRARRGVLLLDRGLPRRAAETSPSGASTCFRSSGWPWRPGSAFGASGEGWIRVCFAVRATRCSPGSRRFRRGERSALRGAQTGLIVPGQAARSAIALIAPARCSTSAAGMASKTNSRARSTCTG